MQVNPSCELTVGREQQPTLRDLPEHYLQVGHCLRSQSHRLSFSNVTLGCLASCPG
jgi:hypothetical protein